ncbi:MAG: response regulator, partial [Chloroflexota bacterium]
MDIQMPGIDGLETTRRLRALHDPQLARIPVIALTSLAMIGARECCLAAGVDEYLSKPVSLPDLLNLIRCLVGRPSAG